MAKKGPRLNQPLPNKPSVNAPQRPAPPTRPTPPKAAKTSSGSQGGGSATLANLNKAFDALPLGRENYRLLFLGILVAVLGYVIVASEDFIDAEADTFSWALNVAPPIILGGYGLMAYAFLKRPKQYADQAEDPARYATITSADQAQD